MDEQNTPQNTPSVDQPTNPKGGNSKQQVIDYISGAKSVLVTVGKDPSVDELASALGLTFMLGKLDKHATAVFSGKTPPAMEFLDPDGTFEDTVDSLRDFIIALDKEKADKLRYKVEENVVKVFITPYRTTLKKEDFEFSQGDFNVDVIIALGVEQSDDIDTAITAHGRILHDATVITINTKNPSSLGVVDWTDQNAGSIAEMLLSISEALGSGLLDEQISNAFLTGIVAATNRFSNDKTSPKIMTMAAQLMAAGANQQLIATNLRREGMITENVRNKKEEESLEDNGELSLDHGKKKSKPTTSVKSESNQPEPGKQKKGDHSAVNKQSYDSPKQPDKTKTPSEPQPNPGDAEKANEVKSPPVSSEEKQQSEEVQTEAPSEYDQASKPSDGFEQSTPVIHQNTRREATGKPSFGGTLNATTAGAEVDKQQQAIREAESNNVALSHDNSASEHDEKASAIEAARQAVEAVADPKETPEVAVSPPPTPVPADGGVHPVDPALMDQQAGNTPSPIQQSEPSPVESFMQPHANGVKPPEQQVINPVVSPPESGMMPPPPPMPPIPQGSADNTLPPLPPPMPAQPFDPSTALQPPTQPDFFQSVNQSQNPWTEAGNDMTSRQADKNSARQEKLDKMTQQYDTAVDKNRELQGKPPLNGDHTTFPLPPQ